MGRWWTRRGIIRGGGAVGVTGMAGCLGGRGDRTDHADADVTVRMTSENRFEPKQVAATVGETVEWRNVGSRPQTVTAYEDEVPSQQTYFASGGFSREVTARVLYPLKGAVLAGDRYLHTFETVGEYGYFSVPTEANGMTGIVVVGE